MNNRIDAVYSRQSVDKKDSISIESQIEFCKYELKGGSCKEYTDKGYSGKNTDRPQFQQLIKDIKQGLIQRVIVYKLDRISRSIIDFSNMMELFQQYKVDFVSTTEKFDTSSPMGRAMLNICIVFAQLERETIQKRVTDAFYSRCQKGFSMGGRTPYGFRREPTIIDGVNTKMMVAEPEAAGHVRLIYEMYADPQTSLGDIVRYFAQAGITKFNRITVGNILRNPIYVQADLTMYEFFKNQGAVIVNDAADFTGLNSCYNYRGRDKERQSGRFDFIDHILVVAPHEGLVSSGTWLTCRKKLMGNRDVSGGIQKKAKNTWLSGKIKCGVCGSALMYAPGQKKISYFRCRNRADHRGCEGPGTLRVFDVEEFVYGKMCEKMDEFQTLTGGNPATVNPKLTALNVELLQLESEIEKLLDTLMNANATLLSYANTKIEELDARRQSIIKAISDISAESVSPEHIERISGYLHDWDNVSFEDKRLVVDGLISVMKVSGENMQVAWKV